MLDGLRSRNELDVRGRPAAGGRGAGDRPGGCCSCCAALLPAVFAIAMGVLVGAVQRSGTSELGDAAHAGRCRVRAAPGADADPPGGQRQPRQPHRGLALRPAHDRAASARRAWGTSRAPSSRATSTMARDFDLGITGPPLSISMDFIASGLVELVGGLAVGRAARRLRLVGAARCSRGAWLATHWLLRESGVWRTATPRRCARRSATPTTPTGSRSIRRPRRSCACSGSPTGRSSASVARRRQLFELQWEATRLRERPVLWSLLLVLAANLVVFWCARRRRGERRALARRARHVRERRGRHEHDRLRRAVLGARRRGRAGRRGAAPAARRWRARARCRRARASGRGLPAREIRFRDVTFAYPATGEPVLEGFDLDDPRRVVARDRRPERRRQDDAREAALPALRPAVAARSRSTASTCARSTSTPGARASPPSSRTSSASSCRCATTSRPAARPTT